MVKLDQQELDNLATKIVKEKSCVEDCLTLIQVYMVRGEYEQAISHCEDTIKSLKELVALEWKHSRHQKVNDLNAQGFHIKVVKRSV
ncbi:hypothetical protein MKY29_18545 [Psychrobacillus sp. FSL K6-2365]|uniref:hypothetical protein n=1 Tax=Psychrobacillus sp. FSL K6-2365 TaxID=2921546 RepID=UPI0030F83AFE